MANPRTPVQKFLAVTDVDATKTFAQRMGAVYLKNTDAANALWFTLDGSAAVGSDGDGRTKLDAGASLNLDDIQVAAVHAICSAGLTASLQIVAVPRSGASSGGAQ